MMEGINRPPGMLTGTGESGGAGRLSACRARRRTSCSRRATRSWGLPPATLSRKATSASSPAAAHRLPGLACRV